MSSTINDFELISCLGKGSFGTVAKCVRKSDKQVYAMKQIKLSKLKQKDKKNALNQIRFLASIEHPNIISYKQAFYDQKSQILCVIMEYANQGDLDGKIKRKIKHKKNFHQKEIWKVAYQSLKGLLTLHQNKIIHRDIKSANIFFHQGNVKIGDLNVAKLLKDKYAATQTGTPYYASPQVWNEQPYQYKSDIWSLGCVLYEMAMLQQPFKADNVQDLYHKVTLGFYERIPQMYSRQLSEFIGKCLTVDQHKRATAQSLLNFQRIKQLKMQLEQFEIQTEKNILLQTIDFPKNFKSLNENLPKSKYQINQKLRRVQTVKNIEFGLNQSKALSKKILVPSLKLVGSQKNIMKKEELTQRTQRTLNGSQKGKEGKQGKKRTSRILKILIKQVSPKVKN